MQRNDRRSISLAAIGAALVVLRAFGVAVLIPGWLPLDDSGRVFAFTSAICLAGMLWLLAVAVVRRGASRSSVIWLVIAVALAMRAMTLAAPRLLSSDVYRYVWDGRVQLAGINPYRYLPIAPELSFLRDDAVYPNINRAGYARTIYPPAAEGFFALAAVVTPGVFGIKLMVAGFDVLTIGVLIALLRIAGRDPAELLIYAWLPLPAWEFAGNAHIDAAASALLALALLFAVRSRAIWTGIMLAVATLTKFLPAVVLPAFWRPRDWRLLIAFLVTLAALYVPYATVGWKVFGFLSDYVSEEGFASGHGIFLLQLLGTITVLPAWATKLYIAVALGLLGLIGARFAFATALPAAPAARVTIQARHAAILGALLLVALSPHYPWYLAWLAPLACLAPLAGVLWLLAAAPLLAHGAFEHLAVPGAVYGPAVMLAIVSLVQGPTHRQPVSPQAARSVQ